MSPGQVAVVTGAGSGIGRATAVAFLRAGYRVALLGRREAALRETAQQGGTAEHGGTAGTAQVIPTDVTDEGQVIEAFEAVVARFGRIDVLFNNAGSFPVASPFEQVELADWRRVVGVNLDGAFLCARQAFGQMKEQRPQGGRIINNGSISAHSPRPHAVAYTASKHAVTGLTKAISLEGRGCRIACGQIDVGNATTELSQSFGRGALQSDGSLRREPMMSADTVAESVLFMAGLPLEANVQFLTVTPPDMPFIGRG